MTRVLSESYIGEVLPADRVPPRLRHLVPDVVTAAYRLAGRNWERVHDGGDGNAVVR